MGSEKQNKMGVFIVLGSESELKSG